MKDETGESGPRHTALEVLHTKIDSFLQQPTIEQHVTDAINPKTTDSTILERAFNLFGELENQLYEEFGIELSTQVIRSFALANDPLTRRIMDELSKHKDQFQHIFETERGSLYFVLPSGQSLRFQRRNSREPENFIDISLPPTTSRDEANIEFYKMHEVADQYVSISSEEAARITGIRTRKYYEREDYLIDIDIIEVLKEINHIQTTQLGTGVSPVEFMLYPTFPPKQNLARLKPNHKGVIDAESLLDPYSRFPSQFIEIANIHFGHPVTKVIHNRTTETLPPEPK